MYSKDEALQYVEVEELARCEASGEELGAEARPEWFSPPGAPWDVARCGKSYGVAFPRNDGGLPEGVAQAAVDIEVEILRKQQKWSNLNVPKQRALLRGKHPAFASNPELAALVDAWLRVHEPVAEDAVDSSSETPPTPTVGPEEAPHRLDLAPENSKVRITADQGAIMATPAGQFPLEKNDVLQMFPAGSTFRKRGGRIHVSFEYNGTSPLIVDGANVAELVPRLIQVMRGGKA